MYNTFISMYIDLGCDRFKECMNCERKGKINKLFQRKQQE